MFENIPSVITKVVNNDLCIGCGACVDICPTKVLKMSWDENGLLLPYQVTACSGESQCLSVCPFNPDDETTISELYDQSLKEHDSFKSNESIGNYTSLYAGYSKQFRATSSSGGLGTWVVNELFSQGLADYAIGVRSCEGGNAHFEYQVIKNIDNVTVHSKTKYYPTTLAGVFDFVLANPGTYVITGLPCFLKSVRLYQKRNQIIKERIKYLIGITCGGMKSSFFTEYLAWKVNIKPAEIANPEYRIKTFAKTAGDYSFGFDKDNHQIAKNIRLVGDTWGNGIFKPNACDYCDDIFAELADVSIGDAWIEPYSLDSKGANLVIVRSREIDTLIEAAIFKKELTLFPETEDRITSTQRGNITHRRVGLQHRLYWLYKDGLEIKGRRVNRKKSGDWVFLKVQRLRMKYRAKSFEAWKKQRSNFEINSYDKDLKEINKQLIFFTKSRHYLTFSWYYRNLFKVLNLIKFKINH